jgi:hypothetical protein
MLELKLTQASYEQLNPKTHILVNSCLEWFNLHVQRRDMFLRILERKAPFSLRAIDWFVTNFTRVHRICIPHPDGLPLDVHGDYQRYLGVYNKKHFDPFARRGRITLTDGAAEWTTTVGQMNFMRWFLGHRLEEMLVSRRQEIERSMQGENLPVPPDSKLPSGGRRGGRVSLGF